MSFPRPILERTRLLKLLSVEVLDVLGEEALVLCRQLLLVQVVRLGPSLYKPTWGATCPPPPPGYLQMCTRPGNTALSSNTTVATHTTLLTNIAVLISTTLLTTTPVSTSTDNKHSSLNKHSSVNNHSTVNEQQS